MLTCEEEAELSNLNYQLKNWVIYCEFCREQEKAARKARLPYEKFKIDLARDLTNEQYYRISDLTGKLYGRTGEYKQPYL